ncbi:hypothetical protein ACH5RR_008054 [Cinchona calisaya]|uniref:AMP-dependent synthetase/ligase domain-containing protein n=1 Tax=Cinchona calisaya TaxID=153742 RepID=A0ABD3AAL0_9GENT
MSSFKPSTFNHQLNVLISLRQPLHKNFSWSSSKTRISSSLSFPQGYSQNPSEPTSQVRFFSSESRSSLLMELVKAVASKGSETEQSIAIRSEQKSYTYHQLISSAWRISTLLCNGDLKTVHDLKGNKHLSGIRIGIVAKPCAEFVAGILGTWLSGGVAVPLALSYPEAELLHVMNDSDVSMILSTEDHQELLKIVAAKTAAQFSLLPHVPSTSPSTELDLSHDGEMNVNGRLQGTENFNEIEDEEPA